MPRETAHAKVNLALHVRARRVDGYHEIESLFAFAEDGDVLEADRRADGGIDLTIDGPFGAGLDAGADNLVWKAATALRAMDGKGQGASLRLTKNLPVASGIGGGSADAAATLRLLCRLWAIAPNTETLHAIALALGSDVPACLASRTQYVGGRGEALDICDLPGLAGMPMLLVNPGVPLSTAPVFAGWDRIDRGALVADDLDGVFEGRNDLESAAIALAPSIAQVLAALREQAGVVIARMSGSGATCFALFGKEEERSDAALALRVTQPDWWIMQTRVRGR